MRGRITSIPFIGQCKNYSYRKIGPEIVQQLEGVLSRESRNTIGILIIPNRDDFTKGVRRIVKSSKYNILLTDKDNIIIDLIDYTIHILENGKKELENKIEKNKLIILELEYRIDRKLFYLILILFLIFFLFFLYIIYLFTIKIKYIEFY